jgi:exodeoxyribonuclease V alpha subunit
VLDPYLDAGVFGPFERQLAEAVLRRQPEAGADDALALAVAARATRLGHVCVRLDQVRAMVAAEERDDNVAGELPWPDVDPWSRALERSPIVRVVDRSDAATTGPDPWDGQPVRPLVWDGGRLYLERYWRYETAIARQLAERGRSGGPAGMGVDRPMLDAVLDALFGPVVDGPPDLQRLAAERGLTEAVSIIVGRPGTGKTHTVARLLVAAHQVASQRGRALTVALAAPTGKAAARMGEAVRHQLADMQQRGEVGAALAATLASTEPMTVHRLLGRRWGPATRFRHDRSDPLPHDLVVIDETSMVSVPLMAKLLDAVRPEASLVLVGDPFQLTSIDAGTVMADIADQRAGADHRAPAPLRGRVTELRQGHRFDEGSGIDDLAEAVRAGHADSVMALLTAGRPDLVWIPPTDNDALASIEADLIAAAREVIAAAVVGDATGALAAATRVKVLAATRRGPGGRDQWSERIRTGVTGTAPSRQAGRWPVGTPLIVTGNDPVNRLFNGDVGVVVQRAGTRVVAVNTDQGMRELAPARLGEAEPWWAMTIHKSQGSEYPGVVIALPAAGSPILTRELLYTAVTRARSTVTVVATEESIRAAVARPVARASGLRDRLWPS